MVINSFKNCKFGFIGVPVQIRDIDLTEIKYDLTLIKALLNSEDLNNEERAAASFKLSVALEAIEQIERETTEGFIQAQIQRREHLSE